MGMFDSEVSADNRMRQFESLSKPAGGNLVNGAEMIANVASLVTGTGAVGLVEKTFGVAKMFTAGLGVATLEENLNFLGAAVEADISRLEKKLDRQGVSIEEIRRRIESSEFAEGVAAAVLHAQRTKQKKRLERMALILVNGLVEDNLEPESLDDMMRAAVELKDEDVLLLAQIYKSQHLLPDSVPITDETELGPVVEAWKTMIHQERLDLPARRESLARLQTNALVQQRIIPGTDYGNEVFILLKNGARFHERLRCLV
jgi:hypothetical protein